MPLILRIFTKEIKSKADKFNQEYCFWKVRMTHSKILEKEEFWLLLNTLLNLDQKVEVDEICEKFGFAHEQLYSVIQMISKMDIHIEKEFKEEKLHFLGPAAPQPVIKFEMNVETWFKFQAHFPLFSEASESPYSEEVKDKLASIENNNVQFDLFSQLDVLASTWSEDSTLELLASQMSPAKELLGFIDECTLEGRSLQVGIGDKNLKVFPWMVIHIEGKLSLVGELHSEKCLVYLNIDELKSAHEIEEKWTPNFSKMEVEEFVKGIRDMAGDEIRLILKLRSLEKFETSLIQNNVNRPCMVVNSRGEYIWAGSVEPNEELFYWLSTLENTVEILDPENFKRQYLEYCENLLKKAS
jgi:hypothetical protein